MSKLFIRYIYFKHFEVNGYHQFLRQYKNEQAVKPTTLTGTTLLFETLNALHKTRFLQFEINTCTLQSNVSVILNQICYVVNFFAFHVMAVKFDFYQEICSIVRVYY